MVHYLYIPYFNVTSGGIGCSMGAPIIKKSNLSLLSKEEQRKKEKITKVLTLNKYIWPWVPAGLDARSDRAGWLLCSALLYGSVLSSEFSVEDSHGMLVDL
jgi:hypothetical protein